MHVFVLVDVQPGKEQGVLSSLKEMEKVVEAFIVFGQYDLILRLENETREELVGLIGRNVRTIDGVRGTLTLIPVHGFER